MTSDNHAGQIIILNGAPRSGKSSIARAIQEEFEGPWINLGVDSYNAMTPKRFLPGIGLRPGGERPELEELVPFLYAALYESIAIHAGLGLNVVADLGHHDSYSQPLGILGDSARRLEGFSVLFVGVRWQDEVHRPGIYDMEVDTSVLTALECAEAIRLRLDLGIPEPSAFERIAGGR
ncbi:chloramphenicol phosphotransferase CPT family protein [Rhizobium leguminosarum]|uniref:chloramphenicol phosphotransferase CPT family protein n=1 Tax=Rhizobium leguminosarum TaxID=384 RepID=UPI001AE3A371|nr:chloramphenicol phosphotransferase [Rhizobium leguminosarum]MBP2447073.1 chloramphenicol 3-O phosphotransferase [Rhizobium leguminosarum]